MSALRACCCARSSFSCRSCSLHCLFMALQCATAVQTSTHVTIQQLMCRVAKVRLQGRSNKKCERAPLSKNKEEEREKSGIKCKKRKNEERKKEKGRKRKEERKKENKETILRREGKRDEILENKKEI